MPPIIARQITLGLQSDPGAHISGIRMSVLHTLKKRQVDVVARLEGGLDHRATDLRQGLFPQPFLTGPTRD